MADFTIDDVLAALKASVAPYNENSNALPVKRDVNPTAAFKRPYETARATPPSMPSSMDAETGGTVAGNEATDHGKQSAIQAWLAKYLPALSGPARALGGAAAMPLDVGADLVRRGVHGAFGLEEEAPYKYSGERAAQIMGALGDTAAPFQVGVDAARKALVDAGARPSSPAAAPPNQGARQVVEGVPASGPVSLPAFAPRPVARAAAPAAASGAFGEQPIDAKRPIVNNADGSFSTERTITVEMDGKHYLIPTIVNGKQVTPDEAVALMKAGKNQPVGVFASAAEADAAAKARSGKIGDMRSAEAQGAFQQPPATRSLSEEFRKRSAEIDRDPKGDLTDDQKKQLELNFFLGMLAKSSQRGARALGAFGESGLDVSKEATNLQDKNFTRSRDKVQQARQDLATEMGFGDKDIDNTRADRRERAEEKRWQDTSTKDNRRLDLLQQQINQGKWKVLDNGKSGTYTLYDQETGQTKDTGIKAPGAKDDRPAEVRLLEHLRNNPDDLNTLLQLKGRDEDKSAARERDFMTTAAKISGDSMGKISFEDAMRQITASIPSRAGAPAALPAGLPEGSKQIGTANGKPVYESPDGKRFTVK